MCDKTRCSSPSEPPPSPPVACTNACAKRVFWYGLPSEEVESSPPRHRAGCATTSHPAEELKQSVQSPRPLRPPEQLQQAPPHAAVAVRVEAGLAAGGQPEVQREHLKAAHHTEPKE